MRRLVRSLRPTLCRAFAAAALSLTLLGCEAKSLAPAGGVVRVGGKPACGGRVVFLPVGGGKPAIGAIGADGHFMLTSGGSDSGAAISIHHIVLKDVRCAGDAKGKNYLATEATRVTVEAGVENTFDLNVDLKNGWQAVTGN